MHTATPVAISDVNLFASSQNGSRWQNSGLTVDNVICKLNSPAVELLLDLILVIQSFVNHLKYLNNDRIETHLLPAEFLPIGDGISSKSPLVCREPLE